MNWWSLLDKILQIILVFVTMTRIAAEFIKKAGISEEVKKNFEKYNYLFIHVLVSLLLWFFAIETWPENLFGIQNVHINPRIVLIILANLVIWNYRKRRVTLSDTLKKTKEGLEMKEKLIYDLRQSLNKENQIGEAIYLKYKRSNKDYDVYKLIKNNSGNEKIQMTWKTFGEGISLLKKRIQDHGGLYPDVIFGINEAGIVIASYLSCKLNGRAKLGIIKTGPRVKRVDKYIRPIEQFECPREEVIQFDGVKIKYPEVQKPNLIAIVDSEIKTGVTGELIIDMINEHYGHDINFLYVGLCGLIRKGELEQINNIDYFGWDIKDVENKPDFIAFCCEEPGFEPPGKIR